MNTKSGTTAALRAVDEDDEINDALAVAGIDDVAEEIRSKAAVKNDGSPTADELHDKAVSHNKDRLEATQKAIATLEGKIKAHDDENVRRALERKGLWHELGRLQEIRAGIEAEKLVLENGR